MGTLQENISSVTVTNATKVALLQLQALISNVLHLLPKVTQLLSCYSIKGVVGNRPHVKDDMLYLRNLFELSINCLWKLSSENFLFLIEKTPPLLNRRSASVQRNSRV